MREPRIRACASALSLGALLPLLLFASAARAGDAAAPAGIGQRAWAVAAYLPNRAFDLCDVVRLRVRVGSGLAAGARVTRHLPVFVGAYKAIWLGLPGPRGRARFPWPFGSESESGLGVGTARVGNATNAPSYGAGEIGAGVMLYLVGLEIGVDPWELVDFLAGVAAVDLSGDDF